LFPKILSQEEAEKGHMDFDFGQFWMKGQNCQWTGKYKAYNRQLSTLIWLVSEAIFNCLA
jgi:hypothetical protein